MKAMYSIFTFGGVVIGTGLGYGLAKNAGVNSAPTVTAGAATPSDDAVCSVAGSAAPDTSGPVMTIDGVEIAESQLPADIRNALFDGQQEAFERNVGRLKEVGVRLVLAKDKDKKADLQRLPTLESLIPAPKPSENEIKAFFEANKERLPPGATLDKFKPQLVEYLEQQGRTKAFQQKLAEIEKSRLKILLRAPIPPIVDIDLSGFPTKGPEGSAVTLVEASDYLCPHCQNEQPTVEGVLKEFDGQIRFVQVNFALRPDGLSGALARGAYCAQKQSKEAFWKFHHAAFAKRLSDKDGGGTPDGVSAVVADLAKGAGLDADALSKCVASEDARASVQTAIDRMSRIGVSGTPTFFLNGQKLHTDHISLREAVASALADVKQGH